MLPVIIPGRSARAGKMPAISRKFLLSLIKPIGKKGQTGAEISHFRQLTHGAITCDLKQVMERELRFDAAQMAIAAAAIGSLTIISPVTASDSAVPDLSGQWSHSNLNLEQPATGPKIMTNTLVDKAGLIDDNAGRLTDFKSPLLTPLASGIAEAHGKYTMTGLSLPDPHNQCWPEPPPFAESIQIQFMVVQRPNEVLIIYSNDQRVRHIPLNVPHHQPLVPTYAGDSVGHYEGDTLIVDTVGIKP